MTSTGSPDATPSTSHAGGKQPLNMHTDTTSGPPNAQPLNMHTDTTSGPPNAQPLNMHTDTTSGPPNAQPLNMHTDIVVSKADSTVTITGETDQQATVSVRLPASVTAALKARIALTHVTPVPQAAGADGVNGVASTVFVFDPHAKVGGDGASVLTITGAATSNAASRTVVLTISGSALTTLQMHREAL
ncbi:hypothetical protein [uncultured Jatrophihabitans sp.]|uniref:hypothetical protein n=1 Tax=uncultured Jatrophihabitans sp. TaxID=1610747 RepID=UPI0035CA1096